MKDETAARKYVFVIRKIREKFGYINHANRQCLKMCEIAENILIENGIIHKANKGRFLYMSAHIAYESDLLRFVNNEF